MEGSKKTVATMIITKKEKYPPIKHHFFLTANHKNYILLITQSSTLLLLEKEGKSSLLKEFKTLAIEPLHFTSTGNGDIIILHSKGICQQYIDQLARDVPFSNIAFDSDIKPLKLIATEKGTFFVICQQNTLVLIEGQRISKQVQCPANLVMREALIDNEKRELFEPKIVIPHQNLGYPYVFSSRQLSHWSQSQYLSKIEKICGQYYLEDQKLSEKQYQMCFSAAHHKIYVLTAHELIILSIKRALNENVDYFVSLRMIISKSEEQIPFFNGVSSNGSLISLDSSTIKIRDPLSYISSFRTIKQRSKKEQMVRFCYSLGQDEYVLIIPGEETTKLHYIHHQQSKLI